MTEKRDSGGHFLVGTSAGPGPDSKYMPEMDDQAFKLALLGLTNEEIAVFFGIDRSTWYRWLKEHDGLRDAVYRGREIADAEVAHSLYRRAVGVKVTSERAFKDKKGEIVIAKTVTELPPDTSAALNWLGNRRRQKWAKADEREAAQREKEVEEGTSVEALRGASDEDLQKRIADILERRAVQSNGGKTDG